MTTFEPTDSSTTDDERSTGPPGRDRRLGALVYVTANSPFGSGEEFIYAEMSAVLEVGWRLTIVPRSPRRGSARRDSGPLIERAISRSLLGPAVLLGALLEASTRPARVFRALSVLRRSRLSIFLKNLTVVPKALWLARLARRRNVVHIHTHWATTNATMVMIAAELAGVPWSCTAHRWDILNDNLLAEKVDRAACFRFTSEDGVRLARDRGADVSHGAFVLFMGVALPDDPPRPGSGDPNVILCPAGLRTVKGHRYLLDALVLLERRGLRPEVWLCGKGDLRESLERRVEELGLADRVRFLGHYPHDDMLRLYQEGRVGMVVLPSLHEGMPISLMEAMGYGVPVVSTEVGGTPELLREGAGLLVPSEDAAALADAIGTLLTDPAQRAALGAAGRERALAELDVRRIAERLTERFSADPAASKAVHGLVEPSTRD